MINVEGHKAFHGTMRVIPKCDNVKPLELSGDWLYKPDTGCWYGRGRSFGADICEVVEEEGCQCDRGGCVANMLEADSRPQKNADEMFREMGYEKSEPFSDSDEIAQYWYDGGKSERNAKISITEDGYVRSREVWDSGEETGLDLTIDELHAVCRLLDEMGAE